MVNKNPWIDFMKKFRALPENQGMTPTEMMHYGSLEYKSSKGSTAMAIPPQDGAGFNLKKMGKKALNTSKQLSETVKQNQQLVNQVLGPEKSAQLAKVMKTTDKVNNVATKVVGSGMNMKKLSKMAHKTTQGAKQATKVIRQNQQLIDQVIGPEKSAQLAKVLKTTDKVNNIASNVMGSGLKNMTKEEIMNILGTDYKGMLEKMKAKQSGGKFNLKNATRKAKHTINTVGKIATPLSAMIAPELTPFLATATKMTGGGYVRGAMVGSSRGISGGSFRGPKSGGAIHSSQFVGDPIMNSYSPFTNGRQMSRGQPPSYSNRSQSV